MLDELEKRAKLVSPTFVQEYTALQQRKARLEAVANFAVLHNPRSSSMNDLRDLLLELSALDSNDSGVGEKKGWIMATEPNYDERDIEDNSILDLPDGTNDKPLMTDDDAEIYQSLTDFF